MLSGARKRLSYANVMATIAVFAAIGGGAVAAVRSIPGPDGVIHACYKAKTGGVRVVASGKKCHKRERALTWNQQGVQGPQGLQGALGPQGLQGERGTDGQAGQPGSAAAYGHVAADGTLDVGRSKNIDRVYRNSNGEYCVQTPVTIHTIDAQISSDPVTLGSPGLSTSRSLPAAQLCSDGMGHTLNIQVTTYNDAGSLSDRAFDIVIN
jgi:hypothetical protein